MRINFTEQAAYGVGFAKTEVLHSTSGSTTTTTVYAGYAPSQTAADSDDGWDIRKTVVVDDGTSQLVTETWGCGSWSNRASLAYKYYNQKP